MVAAAEQLDAGVRATALGRVGALLGPGHGLDLARATAVMELADRLLQSVPPAWTDAQRFGWLAGQAGLRNRGNAALPNFGSRDHRPVTGRLVGLLELAAQVFDHSAPGLTWSTGPRALSCAARMPRSARPARRC